MQALNFRVRRAIKRLHWRFKSNGSEWILGRVACMGQDVWELLEDKRLLINFQKGRLDQLARWSRMPWTVPRPLVVKKHLTRLDIFPLVLQQRMWNDLPRKPPAAIIMDSYAELTDQLFRHRVEGWTFCCNYGDLQHDESFALAFESLGLIPIESLERLYVDFFRGAWKRWGDVPIYFLHFPTILDPRPKFRERGAEIRRVLASISSEYPLVRNVWVDDKHVFPPDQVPQELEGFPYHYHYETYQLLVESLKEQMKD